MNDLKPFKHGEESTHGVCHKHNIGYKSACCECSGRGDCGVPFERNEIIEEIALAIKKRIYWKVIS